MASVQPEYSQVRKGGAEPISILHAHAMDNPASHCSNDGVPESVDGGWPGMAVAMGLTAALA